MIEQPIDVLKEYPIRKSRKQKKLFRDDVCRYLQELGYECVVEKGSCGSKNIVVGNPENAKHLITAHYDTCAAMPFPNLITPCNFWAFMGYQLVLTLLLFVPAVLLSALFGLLFSSPNIGDGVFFGTLMLAVILLMYGPANQHNANDNTSGVVTLLEIAKSMPESHRHQVCFVLFDLEEAGLIGSASYRSAHKLESKEQLVWNLDCVGEGNEIVFFPSKNVIKNRKKMTFLRRCETQLATKRISICDKGFRYYPSDQRNFPYGVGIAALKQGKYGLYLSKIHTKRDTILDETNVNILRAAIVSAITCDGVR